MKIDVLTVFPKMFEGPFSESMVKRATDQGKVEIKIHNLRDWTEDVHKSIDAPPYGGGAGMVMRVDVIDMALSDLRKEDSRVILLDTKGERYSQRKARELAKTEHLILIAGHYEGIDHRVHDHLVDEVISIGDYVLTGGEIPTMVLIDSVVRLQEGVLGNSESLEGESYDQGSERSAPQYTRPEEYKGWSVPKVLLSGNHAEISKWREENRS